MFLEHLFFLEVDSSKVLSSTSASRIPRFPALHGHCLGHWAFEEMHFPSQLEGWDSPPIISFNIIQHQKIPNWNMSVVIGIGDLLEPGDTPRVLWGHYQFCSHF